MLLLFIEYFCLYDMRLVILHLKTSNKLYLFWWSRCNYCQWVSVLPLFRSFFSSLYLHGVPSEQNLWTILKCISILILPQFISCAFRDLWCRIKVANISFHFGCCSLIQPLLLTHKLQGILVGGTVLKTKYILTCLFSNPHQWTGWVTPCEGMEPQ